MLQGFQSGRKAHLELLHLKFSRPHAAGDPCRRLPDLNFSEWLPGPYGSANLREANRSARAENTVWHFAGFPRMRLIRLPKVEIGPGLASLASHGVFNAPAAARLRNDIAHPALPFLDQLSHIREVPRRDSMPAVNVVFARKRQKTHRWLAGPTVWAEFASIAAECPLLGPQIRLSQFTHSSLT